ncbi:MAG: HDIG domain-containing protein [Verrucomicrobia bacterium]|nr:HDIG domain-containing protein [Verrucomicrobiota bacterium]
MTTPLPTPVSPAPPGRPRAWLTRWHLGRAALFVCVLASLIGLFAIGDLSGLLDLSPGQRSPRTVISSIEFDFQDGPATAAERERAAAVVPTVWKLSLDGFENSWQRITRLLDRLTTGNMEDAIERWNESSRYALSADEARALARFVAGKRARLSEANRLLRETAAAGVVADRSEVEAITSAQTDAIAITPGERAVRVADLSTPTEALVVFDKQFLGASSETAATHAAWRQLAADALQPNLRFDRAETTRRKNAAREQVLPVLRHVRNGQPIVYQGQEVTDDALALLRAYNAELIRQRTVEARRMERYGQGFLLFIVLVASCGYLWSNHPQMLRSISQLLLLVLLALLNLALAKGIMIFSSRTELVPFAVAQFAIPMAVAPILAAVLLQAGLGVFLTVFVSVLTALMAGNSFPLLITGMVSGFVGVYFTQHMRRRSRLVRAGLAIVGAELVCIVALAGMTHTAADTLGPQAAAGVINAVVTVFLASGLLPVFEYIFTITTDMRLLELADLNHPLLRKLCLDAPGTYHHSLVVASLAENAAEAVGANPVLARVASYYHDIGKASQPQFFTENQPPGANPHDQLPPGESFRILADHIETGEELARKHRLSPPIIDVIRQHHGTTLARSFFHKAREQAKAAAAVVRPINGAAQADTVLLPREEDFRYAGPKPNSKETAIISLADAVESASRSLRDPTPDSVRALVTDIINRRFEDGQLNEADITIQQLHVIAGRFVQTLLGMHHTRVAYPQDEGQAAPRADQPQQSPAPPADQQSRTA